MHAGFTLLEVLAASVLTALVSVSVVATCRLAGRSQGTATASVGATLPPGRLSQPTPSPRSGSAMPMSGTPIHLTDEAAASGAQSMEWLSVPPAEGVGATVVRLIPAAEPP